MSQEQDIIAMLVDSFRSVFASPAFRDLLLALLGVFVFSTIMRWCALLLNPFRGRHTKPSDKITESEAEAEAEAEAEVTCCFRCDCEDCKSYESGKFCPRCDRFESCAYCSAREHCDL